MHVYATLRGRSSEEDRASESHGGTGRVGGRCHPAKAPLREGIPRGLAHIAPAAPLCDNQTSMASDVRWKQRFDSFTRALSLLQLALANRDLTTFNDLEREGLVQRFEYTFELAWKVLKDYLEHSGIILEQITPRAVIRASFAAKIVPDGQVWIDMLLRRNEMSHTYDAAKFERAVIEISTSYLPALQRLHTTLSAELA